MAETKQPKIDRQSEYIVDTDQRSKRIRLCINACDGINPEAVPHLMRACEAVMESCLGMADDDNRFVDLAFRAIRIAIMDQEDVAKLEYTGDNN